MSAGNVPVPATPSTGHRPDELLGLCRERARGSAEWSAAREELVRRFTPLVRVRAQTILLMRFYGNLTQEQIAARLGISQMHVSRLQARALARLRELVLGDPAHPAPDRLASPASRDG